MVSLFGWQFKRKDTTPEPPSFSPRETDDGAIVVAAGGSQFTYLDLDGTVRTQAELVTRYREMTNFPACYNAVDEIVNEGIPDDEDAGLDIILDNVKIPANVKKVIEEEFENILDILNYKHMAYDIFRRWYVDGRLYFHVIVDEKNTQNGIEELRYIDPRKIRKVREVVKRPISGNQVNTGEAVVTQTKDEYYIFSDKGFNVTGGNKYSGPSMTGLKIAKDAIAYITSGLTDPAGSMVLSYLHSAIKPLNQLSTLEDASVIYRLVRSTERRIWYIDIGSLPRMKAEQYVRDIMTKHKNRLTYDASSGEIQDARKFLTITEDYWLPRRSDGQGTKVEQLPPGTGWSMDDIEYFLKKLYQSLHVPVGRIAPDDMYTTGIATEITRDEVKFGKFITRLRNKFGRLFIELLKKQLVLKQIFTIEDFEEIQNQIEFQFSKDNYFLEMKENQVLTARANLVMAMAPMVGRFYSNEWVRKNILKQTDDDIEENDQAIADEMENPQFQGMIGQPPLPEEQGPPQDGEGGMIIDPNAVGDPNQEYNKGKDTKPNNDNKKSAKPSGKKPNFKSVADILAKGS